MIAPTLDDAFHLFRFPNVTFLGSWVAIYEPQSSGTIHNLPIIATDTTLVPIDVSPNTSDICLSTVLDAVTSNEPVKTFLLEVPAKDVRIREVGLPKACSSVMCDSLHKSTKNDNRCPALTGGRSDRRCLMFKVTIKGFAIKRCAYSSESLADILISKAVLQVILTLFSVRCITQVTMASYVKNT
jgi:hypothetical protein